MRTQTAGIISIITILPWLWMATQPVAPSPTAQQTTSVTIPVFVTDAHGKPASGVSQDDVSIVDNNTPNQTAVAIHSGTESPLRVGILIDKSNSQRLTGLYRAALQAMYTFMKQSLRGNDSKVFLEPFDHVLHSPTPWMSAEELAKLPVDLTPSGATALFNAIELACRDRMENDAAIPARRVLIILSDGEDNQSNITLNAAIASAQRAATVIFGVSTGENSSSPDAGSATLKRLTEKTGGKAFLHLSANEMAKVFSEIAEELNNMYLLTYLPAPSQSGSFHQIEVKAVSDKKLRVRAPKGYYTRNQ